MTDVNNLAKHLGDEWEEIIRTRRRRERQEQKEKEKEENHWKFIAGDLVAKYLKKDLDIQVYKGAGSKEKNKESFRPLENILRYLSEHEDFTNEIKKDSNGEGDKSI